MWSQLAEQISSDDKIIWFHAASLGEFEQGLPIIERSKKEFKNHKILVTFFSPSGYEVKKTHPCADIITYLPLDTRKNVQRFLGLVKPRMAVFIKYEFWPNYLQALEKQKIPTLLVSAVFRKDQVFFKPYGGWMKGRLHTFEHFFVQDQASAQLLQSIGFENISVSGDTRFDRVAEILDTDFSLDFVEEFLEGKTCIVYGSTWPEDEALIIPFVQQSNGIKHILAPHKIDDAQIAELRKKLGDKTVLYSEREASDLKKAEVLIINTVGILSKLYRYADIVYVGGGMGNTGLHNTLEPAVFGIPVVIGKNYDTFKEAVALEKLGGIISISDADSFYKAMNQLLSSPEKRQELGRINQDFTKKGRGASVQIMDFLRKSIEN